MIEYKENGNLAILDNIKFRKDKQTGYFLASIKTNGARKRLHVYVWEKVNGPVPKGYVIHHIDHDKNNNELSNLVCLTSEEHHRIHAEEVTEETRQKWRDNLANKARPQANIWHGSEAGHDWHKLHYEQMKDKWYKKGEFTCLYCGKQFTATVVKLNRFCSNNCKSAYRRKLGVDNETRKCKYCGGEFSANKYSSTKYCSRKCINAARYGEKCVA